MASHPLQRLTSPSRSLSLILHVLGVASFSYNFHFLTTWDTPFAKAYGWHFQFLTIIGLTSSLVAFAFGILADLTSVPVLFQAKNAVAVLATPLEVVISILYWGIRFIDTSLLIPDDFRLDLLPDVGFHLAPAVFLTLDLILFSPPWTISAYGTMTLSTVLAFAYWYWVELCFSHNGW
ncbi:FAR-17a/AIG1-like protein [Ilyonectria sp. MPI-CAGE-AT-0026]|nr:FAR-17a/AIG1-like protein [Ilyonectria sp. MPI-CAGE-AT-0026]